MKLDYLSWNRALQMLSKTALQFFFNLINVLVIKSDNRNKLDALAESTRHIE